MEEKSVIQGNQNKNKGTGNQHDKKMTPQQKTRTLKAPP